jgi:hypothetical protein
VQRSAAEDGGHITSGMPQPRNQPDQHSDQRHPWQAAGYGSWIQYIEHSIVVVAPGSSVGDWARKVACVAGFSTSFAKPTVPRRHTLFPKRLRTLFPKVAIAHASRALMRRIRQRVSGGGIALAVAQDAHLFLKTRLAQLVQHPLKYDCGILAADPLAHEWKCDGPETVRCGPAQGVACSFSQGTTHLYTVCDPPEESLTSSTTTGLAPRMLKSWETMREPGFIFASCGISFTFRSGNR